uniref:Uncharacterized protein n=1 Tax=Salix viminalis TaxID=40686 RepID=A0A6N2KHB1_SALVM
MLPTLPSLYLFSCSVCYSRVQKSRAADLSSKYQNTVITRRFTRAGWQRRANVFEEIDDWLDCSYLHLQ